MVRQSSPKPDPKPEPITKEALLLVEGKDPLRFFEILCKHLGLSQQLQIMNFGGVNQLRGFLVGLPGASGFADVKSIGIIRDAETNATGAFQSVTASLEHALEQRSWDGQPAVDILILPGQGRPGMLETLLCETFADAPENCCIDAFFKCVEQCPDSDVRNPEKPVCELFWQPNRSVSFRRRCRPGRVLEPGSRGTGASPHVSPSRGCRRELTIMPNDPPTSIPIHCRRRPAPDGTHLGKPPGTASPGLVSGDGIQVC
ncbi:MAG: hypothetical protein OXE74_07555, partial [Cyanobacteria bacterium MAG CAR2_bin_4]|nr:hypothetical protein [Cyanobacteria bacterium MAG CAR2_bin_4]